MRPTFASPSRLGISRNVDGSGIATMSDSSIALKPVIDDPSKPMPSSSAPSASLGVIAKLLRCPSMSVNHRRTNSTPSCSSRLSTSLRDCSLDVARFFASTCAIVSSSENTKSPETRRARARGSVASHRRESLHSFRKSGRRDRVDEDERRIGLNEALFREVNERGRTINEGFSQVLQDAEFVCECGNEGCAERFTLTLDDHKRVRA